MPPIFPSPLAGESVRNLLFPSPLVGEGARNLLFPSPLVGEGARRAGEGYTPPLPQGEKRLTKVAVSKNFSIYPKSLKMQSYTRVFQKGTSISLLILPTNFINDITKYNAIIEIYLDQKILMFQRSMTN